jgi:hypothetical protein
MLQMLGAPSNPVLPVLAEVGAAAVRCAWMLYVCICGPLGRPAYISIGVIMDVFYIRDGQQGPEMGMVFKCS